MKTLFLTVIMAVLLQVIAFAQMEGTQIEGKVVAKNDDVVFHQIDAHTWVGTGKAMFNESLYLLEGDTKALLIDAGTKIADLDKLIAAITKKPVILVATHAHPDHYFGKNGETRQRIDDIASVSKDVLAGKVKGEENPNGMGGLNRVVKTNGMSINYSEASIK
jgi:hypothetical protein